MIEQLKMYPSGFWGSSTVPQTAPMNVITTAKQLFNKGLNPHVSRYVANQEVVDLWTDVNSGTPEFKTFAFKERILRCALQAFGTTSVLDWVNAQADSPYYSDHHRRWIDETMHYVYDSRPRQMSENNWRFLLTTDNEAHRGERLSHVVKHYLLGERLRTEPYAIPARPGLTMVQFLTHWCQQDNGINDLLGSLNNLFGKR